MTKKSIVVFLFSLLTQTLFSQQIHHFQEGLVLNTNLRYGREARIQDEVAYKLFKGEFVVPTEGSTFTDQNGEIAWKKVFADSSRTFIGEDFSDGYLFLQFDSDKEQVALLNVSGHNMLYFNGAPYAGDIYKSGWLYSPVQLTKGQNSILVRISRWARSQGIQARLEFPEKKVLVNVEDPTMPHVIVGEKHGFLTGAIVVINATNNSLENLSITSKLEGKEVNTKIPSIPPMSTRKVGFDFNPSNINAKGGFCCLIQLKDKGKIIDETTIQIDAVDRNNHYSATFVSDIDGSVQYYGVAPQMGGHKSNFALFLSVHGAGVEAIGQARAYQSKDWGTLVAPTNRRPRGFNWEEWGRLDALEVLEIAKQKYRPDPQRIYLTGHSMGGHGTWYLGATYPDKWAAIAPCAGYPTLLGYGSADGRIPREASSDIEKILLQASSPSDVFELVKNYKDHGVYVFHGDSDEVVSVNFARQMRKVLADFHSDFSYYEYPGGSHWFGNESVDWPPLFDYFKWHNNKSDTEVNEINFTSASPAISSKNRWAEILQQQYSFKYSRIDLKRNLEEKFIKGTTENVLTLGLSMKDFQAGDLITIEIDDSEPISFTVKTNNDIAYLLNGESWKLGNKPNPQEKGTVRNGSFKEPFNHRMVFVYGTSGTKEENLANYAKARYDAQVWYYRGNGAVDMISDKAFSPEKFKDRGVIVYGNATNNNAWKKLLSDCPIDVRRGSIKVGDKEYRGDDLGAYFMWPRKDSNIASVAVVSGSGIVGMKATEANQYFAAASGFPDFMVFSVEMLKSGIEGIRCAGFYTNDWKIDVDNSAFGDDKAIGKSK